MGQILGNFAQSSTYKAKAYVARAEGQAAKIAANKKAANLEEEARADSHLAAKNMMMQRENQTDAKEAVRNALASSGFTSEGSGRQAAIAAADVFETAIRDAALSNAISDINKRYEADVTRHQGNIAMQQANAEANQLEGLAKNARVSGWIQLGGTVASVGAAALTNIGTPSQIQAKDPLTGKLLTNTDGTPKMVANPEYTSLLSAGKGAYDILGDSLTAMPGSLNTTSKNGGSYIYKLLSQLLEEKKKETTNKPA